MMEGMTSGSLEALSSAGGLLGEVGGELSAGYDTHYFFRGADLGENAVWTGLDFAIPLTEALELGIGAWYINPTKDAFDDELDLYASLGTSIGALDVAVGYTAYIYPEADGGDTNEVGISVGTSVGMFSVGAGYYYDFDLEASYYEGTIGVEVPLGDSLSAGLSATGGFVESDYAHTTVAVEFPISLSDSASLTPYVAGVFPGSDVYGDADDEVFGGAAISVSF